MADQVDPNMFTTPFQLTKAFHRDVYEAVDPKNSSLNATGKVVLVTGAAGGLGYNIARAWSIAKADGVVLVGRNKKTLEETSKALQVPNLAISGDITSESDVKSIFEQAIAKFGKVDVVINAAGGMATGAIAESELSQWWSDFESHIKGPYLLARQFIKSNGGNGTFINLVSVGASFVAPGMSSYSSAQLAAIKLGECLDVEQPNLRVFSIHPGIVEAEGGRGSVIDNFTPFAKDKPALTGGVTLYLHKPEADFLRGGYFSASWDVKEAEKHKEEIKEQKLLKLSFIGAKLGPEGHPWGH